MLYWCYAQPKNANVQHHTQIFNVPSKTGKWPAYSTAKISLLTACDAYKLHNINLM